MPKSLKWKEVRCRACREPIAVDATRCPHCQTHFTAEEVAKRKRDQTQGAAAGCGCLAVVGIVIASLTMCSSGHQQVAPKSVAKAGVPQKNEPPAPAELQAATTTFYRDIMSAMQPCDAGGKKAAIVARQIGKARASVYDGYAAAKEMVDGCRNSEEAIAAVTYPGEFTGEIKDAADKVVETCRDAATMKQMAGETELEVYDGDMKPSKVSELKERIDAGQAGVLQCVVLGMQLAGKAGVDAKEFSKIAE